MPVNNTSDSSDGAGEHRERVKDVVVRAIALPRSERAAYIAHACAGDALLAIHIRDLVAAHDAAGSFMRGAGADGLAGRSAPTDRSTSPVPNIPDHTLVGTRVGPYKLLQLIGEGGFGSVFLAEQAEPVRRRVAVKIIKLGMDTRQVIARFEAERQALALMDHPHIAKVLDAGETSAGRPYFVMEYVTGDPITAFANAHALSIKDRLALFAQVCAAVQHAHHKGIIHRDIKPGNVLVSMTDGQPYAKVIDFGIAKATAQPLTDKTLFTEHRQLIGTPEYMSPEQAEGSADIDTRTDVYALGVLLYELLTGLTPFDGKRLRSAAYAELQRIIKEEEPPMPSVRLSRAALGAPTPFAVSPGPGGSGVPRGSPESTSSSSRSPTLTPAQLRGELDWIVMKALDKDRGRRYDTPMQLAADVQRHVAGEAVTAAPPSLGYRVRKFTKRHRNGVLMTSAIVLSLAVGLGFAQYNGIVATRNAQIAIAEKQRADALAVSRKELADGAITVLKGAYDRMKRVYEAKGDELVRSKMSSLLDARLRGLETDPSGKVALDAIGSEMTRLIDSVHESADAAEWSAYTANIALAQQALDANDYPEARRILQRTSRLKSGWEFQFLLRSAAATLWQKPGSSSGVRFSNDGQRVVFIEHRHVFDVETGASLGTTDETLGSVYSGIVDADGTVSTRIAVNHDWDSWPESAQQLVRSLTRPSVDALALSFSPDGTRLLWVDSGSSLEGPSCVRMIPVEQWGGPIRLLDNPSRGGHPQADGRTRRLLVGGRDLQPLRIQAILASSPNGPSGLWITSPDGTRRIVAQHAPSGTAKERGGDRTIRFFEARDGKPTLPATAEHPEGVYREVAVFRMPDAVKDLQMTGDGTRLIIHLANGSARVWDIRDPEERRKEMLVERAERTPAGAFVETQWNDETTADDGRRIPRVATDELREAIIASTTLTPLQRVAAAELLEYRKQEASDDAEKTLRMLAESETEQVVVQTKAREAAVPPRVREILIARAAQWNPSGDALNNIAWRLVRFPPVTHEAAIRAVGLARRAIASEESSENTAMYTNTLGVALYRAGEFEAALEALKSSDALWTAWDQPMPADVAFIAMAQWRLGKHEEARTAVGRLNTLCRTEEWKNDAEAQAWQQEVVEVLGLQLNPSVP